MKEKSYAILLVLACAASVASAQIAPSPGPFTLQGTLAGTSLRLVASGLANPVAITNAGDDRLFVTLQEGRVVIVENGQLRAQAFLDIRDRVLAGGERGLLSIAFHPDYADNGFFFVDYTDQAGDTVISRFAVTDDPNRADPASERKLLGIDQPFANHNGGQLQFGPDGYLYIGMGDGGSGFDPQCYAQKDGELLGKLLRLDVDQNVNAAPFHGIPLDNPFRGPGNPRDEIWASGLRNPWRFSFDRQTGDLWIADVGQGEREEIDFQPAGSRGGENYGWKTMEGTLCQSRTACPAATPPCNASAYTLPVLEYAHPGGCSVTGGYVYRGKRFPQLGGTYFFGDLCSGIHYAAQRQGGNLVVRRLAQTTPNLTTYGEDRDGELYLATLNGQLYALEGPNPSPAASPEEVGLFEPPASRFHLKSANTAAAAVKSFRFGARHSGWLPIAGDWDGDGKATIGFWDPDAETFRLKNALQGGASDIVLRVDPPAAEMLPVAGDWNGDGRDTVGLYDPAASRFYLKDSLTGSGFEIQRTVSAGASGPGKLPVAGDWNGDGRDSVGVFNPATSGFELTNSLVEGDPINYRFAFDAEGLPVAGDWDGDGVDTVGTYETKNRTFRLTNQVAGAVPQISFRFGQRRAAWLPLAGNWGL